MLQFVASGVLRIVGEVDCTLESAAVPVCNRLPIGMTKAVPCVEKTSRVGELFFTGDYLSGDFRPDKWDSEFAYPFPFAECRQPILDSLWGDNTRFAAQCNFNLGGGNGAIGDGTWHRNSSGECGKPFAMQSLSAIRRKVDYSKSRAQPY